MQFFRNKIIIGVLCIVLGLVVGFVLIPGSRDAQNATIQVVRATQDIPQGSCIDETMIEAVTVLASQVNLTESKVEDFIGSYAAAKIYTGDYLTAEKLNPTAVDPIAAATDHGKMIVSVTVPSLAASASGIIQPGDVVMLMASGIDPEDYNESSSGTQIQNNIATGGNTLHYNNETNQFYYENSSTEVLTQSTLFSSTDDLDEMVIIDKIKYLEVCSVSASDGTNSVVNPTIAEGESNSLPYTISFFCNEDQALILAQIEQEGEFHVAFVAHGEDANDYIPAAQRVLSGESSGNMSEDMTGNTGANTNQNTGSNLEGSIGE